MKFKRVKRSHLLGHTQVEFSEDPPRHVDLPFQIVATPYGIHFVGESSVLTNHDDLDEFAQAVSQAWTEHIALRPKISSPHG